MKKFKIIVAEDDAIILSGFVLMLESLGFDVIAGVSNGVEAVEHASRLKPDCILMDVNMPMMSGVDAAQQIYSALRIPTVLITGVKEHLSYALKPNSGVFGYIQKPADEYELQTVISIAIQLCRDGLSKQDRADAAEKKLEERKSIERAKGILMDEFDMKEQQAMIYLQKKSRDSNMKIIDVARKVIMLYGK